MGGIDGSAVLGGGLYLRGAAKEVLPIAIAAGAANL